MEKEIKENKMSDDYRILSEKYELLLKANEEIIERHNKETHLHRKHETLLKEMGGLTKIGVWELDIESGSLFWTDEVKLIHDVDLSYQPELEAALNFYVPESRVKVEEAIARSIKTGEVFDLELELLTAKEVRKQVRVIGRTDLEAGMVYGTIQDITEQKLIHDAQLFLINSRYLENRETFFESLARFLSESLNMEFVCIDRLTGGNLAARTLAMYYKGKFDDNIEYTLKETPCGEVVGKNICYYPKGVRNLFPYDQALQDMSAESYVGTTLWSSDGKPIGLIAVIGEKPLEDHHLVETILNLVSTRAAGELERSEVEYQLKLRREELEKQISLKDRFFSIIAHDLRSPFHVFLNLTEIMAYEGEELKLSEMLQLSKDLNHSAKNLFNLLNNLLEWSKLQQGMLTFNSEKIHLNELIQQHVDLLMEQGNQKDINITTDLVEGVEVEGDRNMLNSIVLNLLSNALKFSNKGSTILIKTRLREDNLVEVKVQDQGIGIPESILDKLFKIEEKTGRPGTAGEKSSGLGLLLCKEFVEKHGGKIWIESTTGKGSSFFFTIKKTAE